MAEWILLLTLYSKSGERLETMSIEGFQSIEECSMRSVDIALDLFMDRSDLGNVKPLCIEDRRKAALNATELP